MAETFSNGGVAAVGSGGITDVATTLPTLYRSGLPTTATFRVKIGSEILKVTTGGQSTASWTVARGQESTTAVAHSEGEPIRQVFTAQAITDALAAAGTNVMTTAGDIVVGGTAGIQTRLATGTDDQVLTVVSGTPAWADAASGGGGGTSGTFTAPVDADFSWVNQGASASVAATASEIYLEDFTSNADNLRLRLKTISAGGCEITGAIIPVFPVLGADTAEGGIVIGGSVAGTFITFGVSYASGVAKLCIRRWDDFDTPNAAYTPFNEPILFSAPIWLQIVDAGFDPARYYYSTDGVNWVQVKSQNKASFLASADVDRAGFYYNYSVSPASGVPSSGIRVVSFVAA